MKPCAPALLALLLAQCSGGAHALGQPSLSSYAARPGTWDPAGMAAASWAAGPDRAPDRVASPESGGRSGSRTGTLGPSSGSGSAGTGSGGGVAGSSRVRCVRSPWATRAGCGQVRRCRGARHRPSAMRRAQDVTGTRSAQPRPAWPRSGRGHCPSPRSRWPCPPTCSARRSRWSACSTRSANRPAGGSRWWRGCARCAIGAWTSTC